MTMIRSTPLSLLVAIATILYAIPAEAKLVDLSHDHGVDTYMSTPLHPKYESEVLFEGDIKPSIYAKSKSYSIGEHGGTHIDAPKHFSKDGLTLEKVPLENTLAEGIMIDCSEEVAENPDYALTLKKVKDWEKKNGKIPRKSAVVLNFNWSRKFNNISEYFNTDDITDAKKYRFPVVGAEAIEFLVDERDINILAMDSMGPDLMTSDFPSHVKMLRNNKIIVENLRDPGRLPVKGFRFYATPVKFVGGTGVQVRAFAEVYENVGGSGSRSSVSFVFCHAMAVVTLVILNAV